ncbi:MAG: hypothetical protein ABJA16_02335 [Nakamurella sp.]
MHRLGAFLRTYWTRGVPGRPTPRSAQVLMLRWWVVALAFKLIGSSWDVSWHFKWLRDDLAPPHVINTVGTGIAVVLVLVHSFTGYGVDRLSLRIMQWGTAVFLIAAPIDVINHRVNGLDLTAWSPSHAMLYLGTAIMIAGIIRVWYLRYPRDGRFSWQWTAGLVALFAFFFENAHFAQLQQEYGILEMASWFRGTPYAEAELLNFAAGQLGRGVDDIALAGFALPIPSWVYPIWAMIVCVPILMVARVMVGKVWTATVITGAYVLYRAVIWPLLVVGTFPPSVVPFWMVLVGLGVDAVFLLRVNLYLRAAVGAVVVTGVGYGSLWLQNVVSSTPTDLGSMDVARMRSAFESGRNLAVVPVDYGSIVWAVPGALITWLVMTYLLNRWTGLDTPRPPAVLITFAAEPARGLNGLLTGAPLDPPTPRAGHRPRARSH